MSIQDIINSLFLKASSHMIKSGKNLFNNDFVSNIKSKKIENFYHIYGKVRAQGKISDFNTHLVIDLSNKVLKNINCSCSQYKEVSKYKKDFLCEHLIATNYKFISLLEKKYGNTHSKLTTKEVGENILCLLEEKSIAKKDVLNLEIKMVYIQSNHLPYYEIEFRIGTKNNMYLINNLEEFIEFRERQEALRINSGFVYKPKTQCFHNLDEGILDFIEEYVKLNKQLNLNKNLSLNFQIIKGKSLRVLPNALKRFLKLSPNKNISIRYECIDCIAPILLEKQLPINFNLKEKDNNFILSTYTNKNLPKALTKKGEVYLFNRRIYIPCEESDKAYKALMEQINKYGELRFSKSVHNFKRIMKILNKVTNDITLDQGIKRLYNNISKPKFYLHKKNEHIICSVKIDYGNDTVDILKDYTGENLIIRDSLKEEKLIMLLERLKFIKKKNFFVFMGNEKEDLYDFLSVGINELKNIGIVKLTKDFEELKLFNSLEINCTVDKIGNEFYFKYFFQEFNNNEVENIYKAFNEGKDFYKRENVFLNLKDDKIREFFALIEEIDLINMLHEDKIKIDENKIFHIEKNMEKNYSLNINGKEHMKEIINKVKDLNEVIYNIPNGLNASLRNYQIEGYKWMKNLSYLGFGGVLADEMGLGKTLQAITFILSEQGKKSLIVTPTSLIYNWVSEFKKFAPTLKIAVIHGEKKKRIELIKKLDEIDVILTTYGTLRLDYQCYSELNFDYCIIDEAQNIKNPLAQNTKRIKGIKAKVKFALTGTPMENNLLELWSIFDFLMPGYLYTKEKFEKKFIKVNDLDIKELKQLIRPFMLRRVKREVLNELPEKIEKKFLVEMTNSQKRLYKVYLKNIKTKLQINEENKITIFSYLTKLRQLCLDPSLLIDDYNGGSGKIKIAMEIINNAIYEEKKILVFSQFTSVLKKLSSIMNKEGINCFYLDGTTKANERVNLVKEFNESNDVRVFLISLKAGGTGLNLTSANLVIHFDPWWNPAVENQATDRAHRIGQKSLVQVIRLISEGTIEEKIVLLQEHKEKLVQNIITDDTGEIKDIKSLTEEELMSLFE